MTREQIKALIDSDVNTNGVEAITGAVLNNVLTQILDFSQDEPFEFRNNSGSNIAKGDIVEISGYDSVNSIIEIQKLQIATEKSNFFIALDDVLNATNGSFAKTFELTGLTFLDSFSIGDKLYWDISTGTYTDTATPDNLFIGICTQNVSPNGAIEVQLNQNPRLYGNGTANKLAKWNDSETLTDSIIQDDGTTIGIGGAPIADALIRLLATDKEALRASVSSANPLISLIALRMLSSAGGGAESTGIEGEAIGGLVNIGVEGNAYGAGAVENIGVKGTATQGSATGENIGGLFIASGGLTNYVLHLQNGTEGINKILLSVTADGKCSFSSLKTINGASLLGSGDISTTQTLAQTLALGNSTNGENIVFDGGDATVTFQEASVDFPYINIVPFAAFPDIIQFQGLKYDADYSANFTTNSLVTKKYVDDNSASSGRFGIANSNGVYTYYTTLTLAMTAATSGQTIEFFTDYTETGAVTITLKNGVNINGNGHTYTLNVANDTTHAMLIDTSGTFKVNNLTVKRINGTGASTQALRISAGISINVELYGDGSFFYCSTGMSVFTPQTTVNMYNIFAQTDASAQYCIYSEGNIYKSIGRGVGIGIGNPAGKVYDSVGISSGNKGMEVAVAYNCTGASSADVGILIPVSAVVVGYLSNCTGISSSNVGITCNKANSIINNCSGYSSSSVGVNFNVVATLQNSTAYSSSYWGAFVTSGKVNNCSIYSSTNYGLYVENASIISNNIIESNALHATFLASNTSNAAQLMNNTLIVGNSAYNCLNATSVITIKYANNAFKGATTAVNANITQGVSNSHDSQGNILI